MRDGNSRRNFGKKLRWQKNIPLANEPEVQRSRPWVREVFMQGFSFAGSCASVRPVIAVIILAAVTWASSAAKAQEVSKQTVQRKTNRWKLSVISDAMPEKFGKDVRTEIEEARLVCRSSTDVPLIEIPLQTITQFTRDTEKDYRISRWLMKAATQPSTVYHRIGSKEYREELKARAGLTIIAMIASLFPSHKEVVHVSWTDEEGTHFALFYLGRREGRAMLAEIKKQTGLEPRDLEKERKAEEKRLKALQRQKAKQAVVPLGELHVTPE
jgi:hypothetical protein